MSFTELVVKRPSIVVVLFTVLGTLGLLSYTQLGYELLPDFSPPIISINTSYPGASPDEVEQSVTRPIEDVLSTLEGVERIRSTSLEGNSSIIVEFQQNADVDPLVQDAQRKINNIRSTLPEDVEDPNVDKVDPQAIPVLQLGVVSNADPRKFYQTVEDQIVPSLTRLNGVGQVNILGGEEREIQVYVDQQRLRNFGISLLQVVQAVNTQNADFPTGRVKNVDAQLVVRVAGKYGTVDELSNLVISRSPDGGVVRVRDIAEVRDATKETTTIYRINGTPSIGLQIVKQEDANAVATSAAVRAELKNIEEVYSSIGLKFIIANDTSDYTREAAEAVQHDLVIAILLVAAVCVLFLHSVRSAFIVMVAIPVSLIVTFGAMYALDYTLNLMTMLGLSLVIGILVDDSIVVLENIHRHLEMGKDKRTAAVDGRNEIGFTAVSITLVDVVVFLPIVFVGGIVGNILGEFATVVVVSTLLSLLVSFTITPALASRIEKLQHPNPDNWWGRFTIGFENVFNRIVDSYERALRWVLKSFWTGLATVGVVVLLLFSAFALVGGGYIGGDFIKQSDRGEFIITMELPQDATLEQSNALALRIENQIRKHPEVERVITVVGFSGTEGNTFFGGGTGSAYLTDFTVLLSPREERSRSTDQFSLDLKQELATVPGVKIRAAPVGFFGGADEAPVQIQVLGPDAESVATAANQILDIVKNTNGASDARLSSLEGRPELKVDINRRKMADFGLTITDVGGTLNAALTGNDDSEFREGTENYDIRVQLNPAYRQNINDIRTITFLSPVTGRPVELQQFADVYYGEGPSKLERFNRTTTTQVKSQIIGRPGGDFIADVQEDVAKLKLPPGVRIQYEGNARQQDESGASLGIAFMLSVFFMYLVMVALYDNYIYPLVVMMGLPVALIGALYALALTMSILDLFTGIGIIMLMGLVGKNAILLVDFANHGKEQGLSSREALVEAGRERLRPIVMTSFAMIFGMLPIATASGAGAEWKNGLAWAIIGGMTVSTFVTPLFIPAVYLWVDNSRAWLGRKFGRRRRPFDPGQSTGYGSSQPEPVAESTMHR